MLFFHLSPGLTRVAHEWLGWVMAVAVMAQVAVNWRAFTGYFRRPVAITILATSAALMALTPLDIVPATATSSPVAAVMGAMGQAQLATVAELAGLTEADAASRLVAVGIAALPGQAMTEITHGDRGVQIQVVAALFAQ
jgi:hypothetical protein